MIDYIVKMLVRQLSAFAVNTEESRGIARLGGMLSDLLLGQKIVKIRRTKLGFGFVINNNITHFKSHIKHN